MYIFKSNLSCASFLASDSDYARKYLEQLNEEYETFRDKPVGALSLSAFREYFKSGNRLAYENGYFRRRAMLRDFALKAWLSGGHSVKRLEEVLEAVCDERTWALPAHLADENDVTTVDLFAAETAQTLTEIVSLLRGALPRGAEEKCIGEVRRRVLDPFIKRSEPYEWESAKSNWSAVCGGCIGMTAIYLLESEAELRKVTDSLEGAFASYLKSFSDDGACLEGLYYQNYGMMYLTAFLDLYKQRTGTDFPIDTKKLKKAADFASKCCLGGGFTVSFSDGYERDKTYLGLSRKLAEMYGSQAVPKEYAAFFFGDECGRWCKASRDIAWANGSFDSETEGDTFFPDANMAILRGENISAAFKGGNNGEPHNHNDAGSVIVVKNGTAVISDIGAGEYTADYFSDGRYGIFCNRSMGHSVPIVDGKEQKAGGKYGAKGFFAAKHTAGADISGAYGYAPLKKCVRTLRLDGETAVISDDFTLDRKTTVTERFITRHSAAVSDGAAIITASGKRIALLTPDKECSVTVKTYTHRAHGGGEEKITAVDFTFTADGDHKFSLTID